MAEDSENGGTNLFVIYKRLRLPEPIKSHLYLSFPSSIPLFGQCGQRYFMEVAI